MKYKKVNLNGPRCIECNELIPKVELKKLDENGGICSWCINSKNWLRFHNDLVVAGWLIWGMPNEEI